MVDECGPRFPSRHDGRYHAMQYFSDGTVKNGLLQLLLVRRKRCSISFHSSGSKDQLLVISMSCESGSKDQLWPDGSMCELGQKIHFFVSISVVDNGISRTAHCPHQAPAPFLTVADYSNIRMA